MRKAIEEEERKHKERLAAAKAEAEARDAVEKAKLREAKLALERAEQQAKAERERKAKVLREQREVQRKRIEQEKQIQEKLKRIGRCPQGFVWLNIGTGYRCAGGSHYCSNAQINM